LPEKNQIKSTSYEFWVGYSWFFKVDNVPARHLWSTSSFAAAGLQLKPSSKP
jgi:hypothetical protein